jgi:hypothetical protein
VLSVFFKLFPAYVACPLSAVFIAPYCVIQVEFVMNSLCAESFGVQTQLTAQAEEATEAAEGASEQVGAAVLDRRAYIVSGQGIRAPRLRIGWCRCALFKILCHDSVCVQFNVKLGFYEIKGFSGALG